MIKNSIKTETVLLRHLNPPSNDYESVYLQLLRFSLYLSRSSLRQSYTILVYLSYFPSTIVSDFYYLTWSTSRIVSITISVYLGNKNLNHAF